MFSSIDEAWNQNLSVYNKTIESFTMNIPSETPSNTPCSCEELIKKILSCSDCTDKIKFILSKQSSPIDKYFLNPINSLSRETKDNLIFLLFVIAFFIIISIVFE
jgi:hypothetical protein